MLSKRLREAHDRLNCRVEASGFKSDEQRDAEIVEAMTLCWRAADEIERLRAGRNRAEGALRTVQFRLRAAKQTGCLNLGWYDILEAVDTALPATPSPADAS